MGAGSSSGDACSGRLTLGKRICFLGVAETLRRTLRGEEFGGIWGRTGIEAVCRWRGVRERGDSGERGDKDTAGVRRGLDREFVAAAGATG
jgi:hypothetical protein